MKSIGNITVILVVLSMILSYIPAYNQVNNHTITLQCTDNQFNKNEFFELAKIIEDRLTTFGLHDSLIKFEVKNSSIDIYLNSEYSTEYISNILLSKGKLQFFIAAEAEELISNLGEGDALFNLLKPRVQNEVSNRDSSKYILGYCKTPERQKVKQYIAENLVHRLNKLQLSTKWIRHSDDHWGLFLVQEPALLSNPHIVQSKLEHDRISNSSNVLITFDEEGSEIWRNVTAEHIGSALAITMDGEVYCAPKIMDEIKGGKCMISGNFTQAEARKIATLVSHDELPLNFKIVD